MVEGYRGRRKSRKSPRNAVKKGEFSYQLLPQSHTQLLFRSLWSLSWLGHLIHPGGIRVDRTSHGTSQIAFPRTSHFSCSFLRGKSLRPPLTPSAPGLPPNHSEIAVPQHLVTRKHSQGAQLRDEKETYLNCFVFFFFMLLRFPCPF